MRFLMLVILHNVLITRLSLWLPQWMLKAFSFSLISVQRDHSEHHLLPQHYPILALNSFLGQTSIRLSTTSLNKFLPLQRDLQWTNFKKSSHISPFLSTYLKQKDGFYVSGASSHKIEKYWVSLTLLITVSVMASEQQFNKIFNKVSLLLQVFRC